MFEFRGHADFLDDVFTDLMAVYGTSVATFFFTSVLRSDLLIAIVWLIFIVLIKVWVFIIGRKIRIFTIALTLYKELSLNMIHLQTLFLSVFIGH